MSMFKFKVGTSQNGQATVEFALAAILFFTVFLAIVEFSHLFYTKLTLQFALREAGRYMITGRADVPDPNDPDNNLSRCDPGADDAVDTKFYKHIKGFGGSNPRSTVTFSVDPDDCGAAGQPVTMTASYTKPWFSVLGNKFLPGGVPLSVSITWVNEPFPSTGGP